MSSRIDAHNLPFAIPYPRSVVDGTKRDPERVNSQMLKLPEPIDAQSIISTEPTKNMPSLEAVFARMQEDLEHVYNMGAEHRQTLTLQTNALVASSTRTDYLETVIQGMQEQLRYLLNRESEHQQLLNLQAETLTVCSRTTRHLEEAFQRIQEEHIVLHSTLSEFRQILAMHAGYFAVYEDRIHHLEGMITTNRHQQRRNHYTRQNQG